MYYFYIKTPIFYFILSQKKCKTVLNEDDYDTQIMILNILINMNTTIVHYTHYAVLFSHDELMFRPQ